MGMPIYVVHAFTDRPFAGNPAAVCFPPAPPSDSWMQQVAAEMRLSETAFVTPAEDGYRLRWFTPTVEVDLCGHATLAAAWVLWETGRLGPGDQARFHTRSGLLTVDQGPMGMTMDFPARPAGPCREWGDLPAALGAQARFIGRNGMDGLVELEDEQAVRSLRPDFALLAQYPVRGVIITAIRRPGLRLRLPLLRPVRACRRIRSPGRRTAAWGHTGASGWGSGAWWATRRRRGAGPSASASTGTGSNSAVRPLSC